MPTNPLFNTQLFGGGSALSGAILVSDIIYSAYRIAGVLGAPGRGYGADAANDGLKVLNSMVDAWQAERLMVWAILRSVFNIVANQQTYVLGTTGTVDWKLQRPERIEQAGFIFNNLNPTIEEPFKILTYQEWAALSPKSLNSTIPYMLYYEPFVPNGHVNLWPVPLANWQIALYTWQNLTTFPSTNTAVVVPPAYQEALEYNLAKMLAMRFQKRANMSAEAMNQARASKARIKAINLTPLEMVVEAAMQGRPGERGRWNILTGKYW
ncbi:MAG TPA: hypothetical protein VKX49_12635 [Bryobacteraceae bacterium]|nr:hypothetical protein [Bryobacteraceae bacterium]